MTNRNAPSIDTKIDDLDLDLDLDFL